MTVAAGITVLLAIELMVVVMVIDGAALSVTSKKADCDKYPPCSCSHSGGIVCNRVPLADVHKAFNRSSTSVDLEELHLSPSLKDATVPQDLLGNRLRFRTIYLSCPKDRYQLMVHPDAFQGTANYTVRLRISLCDLSRLNFTFLEGFQQLESLKIWYSYDVHLAGWSHLPALPALTDLSIYQCNGLNNWTSFPDLVNGLREVDLQGNDLKDEGMSRILEWILKSSAGTLQKLLIGAYIDGNNLTRVPSQIGSFSRLDFLDLSGSYNPSKKGSEIIKPSGIKTVAACLLSFGSAPVRSLSIHSAGLSVIEPGAFQGDFSRATVNLAYNNLTRFEQSVFQPMLQQMSRSNGSLHLVGNRIDCTSDLCHLAWIIRDNSHLLKTAKDAKCSNGIAFTQFRREEFAHCPRLSRSSGNVIHSKCAAAMPRTTGIITISSHSPPILIALNNVALCAILSIAVFTIT